MGGETYVAQKRVAVWVLCLLADAHFLSLDITPDGKRFIGIAAEGQPQSEGAAPQMQVVLNWFEEFKQRVPVK